MCEECNEICSRCFKLEDYLEEAEEKLRRAEKVRLDLKALVGKLTDTPTDDVYETHGLDYTTICHAKVDKLIADLKAYKESQK